LAEKWDDTGRRSLIVTGSLCQNWLMEKGLTGGKRTASAVQELTTTALL